MTDEQRGARQERERIVAWAEARRAALQTRIDKQEASGEPVSMRAWSDRDAFADLIRAIERGDHLPAKESAALEQREKG